MKMYKIIYIINKKTYMVTDLDNIFYYFIKMFYVKYIFIF